MAYALVFNWAELNLGLESAAKDTTGCDLLVVAVTHDDSTDASLVDNKSNTYTALTQRSDGSGANRKLRLFYCQAPTVGTGHTWTPSPFNKRNSLGILGFSGSVATPADGENGFGAENVSSMATGAVVPSQNDDVLVAAWGVTSLGGLTTGTLDSSFTAVDFVADSYANGVKTGYLIQTTAASANVTWTPGGSNIYGACGLAAFKSTAGGGGGTILRQMMQHHGGYRKPRSRRQQIAMPSFSEFLRYGKRAA